MCDLILCDLILCDLILCDLILYGRRHDVMLKGNWSAKPKFLNK